MRKTSSSRACGRCKQKHLKCDEARPSCTKCLSVGAQCPGYSSLSRFIDEGVNVRRRYERESSRPLRRKNYRNDRSSSSNSPFIPVSQSSWTLPDIDDAGGGEQSHPTPISANFQTPQHHEDNPLDARDSPLGVQNTPSLDFTASRGTDTLTPSGSSDLRETVHGLGHGLLSPPDGQDHASHRNVSANTSQFSIGHDHEIAFLTRYFVENIGPWLDLFDKDRFYTVYVPVQALECLLLKYSIAAVAAKHLGRLQGLRNSKPHWRSRPSIMEAYPDSHRVDWLYKAANYYYRTLSYLRHEMPQGWPGSALVDCELSRHGYSANGLPLNTMETDLEHELSLISRRMKICRDEVIAATSILALYESIDASNDEWLQHLNGLKSLFNALKANPPTANVPNDCGVDIFRTQGAKTVFWNFASQEYLAAYIHESLTRIDPEDYPSWRVAGLPIDDKGSILWHEVEDKNIDKTVPPASLFSKILIWLLCRLTYVLYSPDNETSVAHGNTQGPGENQNARWRQIRAELDMWFQSLPKTLVPCARIEQPYVTGSGNDAPYTSPFPEIYYSCTMVAAMMQNYYFARLLVLLYMPHEANNRKTSTPQARLKEHRQFTIEIESCCREVCGIALARPHCSVRVQMVQPLYLVGQCVDEELKRKVVIELLRGIQADLAWETEYRVKQLLELWNADVDGLGAR
ncbi:hypothetical protein FQN52_000449 [Onygenales sp. PD_12]|nr:hypothetical protein FQN52_000449 [Onygenales sp. PD_12]